MRISIGGGIRLPSREPFPRLPPTLYKKYMSHTKPMSFYNIAVQCLFI